MNKKQKKRGSVVGTALVVSSVANIVLSGALIYGVHEYREVEYKLDKARENIVQYEKSLKDQDNEITGLEKDVKHLTKNKQDLQSKNDTLLKDNDKLNQKLKSEDKKIAQLQQKLKQAESEVEKSRKK